MRVLAVNRPLWSLLGVWWEAIAATGWTVWWGVVQVVLDRVGGPPIG
ncbi:hypothetical protein [Saccharopolyspora sp. 5N708]